MEAHFSQSKIKIKTWFSWEFVFAHIKSVSSFKSQDYEIKKIKIMRWKKTSYIEMTKSKLWDKKSTCKIKIETLE